MTINIDLTIKYKLIVFSIAMLCIQPLFIKSVDAAVSISSYDWAVTPGGSGREEVKDIFLDSSGNVYGIGEFTGTADFDDGAGVDNHTTSGAFDYDIFISKMSLDSTYQWTISFPSINSDDAIGIEESPGGNIVAVGRFSGTIDLDPGVGTDIYASGGNFIAEYDTTGAYVGAIAVYAASEPIYPYKMTVDSSGNIYLMGDFSGTVDFDPTAGVDSISSAGFSDGFITKISGAGAYQWTRTIGLAANVTSIVEVDIASDGGVVYAGTFSGTTDLDPTAGVDSYISNGSTDMFLTKLNSDGSYSWSSSWGSALSDGGTRITTSPDGHIYISGNTNTTTDIDPTGVTYNVAAGPYYSKFQNDGIFINGVGFASSNTIQAIEVDIQNSLIVVFMGNNGSMDVDPGPDTVTVSTTKWGSVLTKYYSDGTYGGWAYEFRNGQNDVFLVNSVKAGSNEQIVFAGRFGSSAVDFDGTGGTDSQSGSGTWQAFYASYSDNYLYQIDNLDSSLDVETSAEANIETGGANGVDNAAEVLRVKDSSSGMVLADITTDVTSDRDWSSVTGDSLSSGVAFIHNLTSAPGTAASFTLYVPYVSGHGQVTICPGASSIGEVIPGCASEVIKTEADGDTSIVNIDGQDYWAITGMTGTGGFGSGLENSVYIDLDAQPATAPSTISTAPEVAVSTADSFYLSYIPSTTEFAASDSVDIAIPFDWSGLAVCAGTGDADGAGGNDHTVAVVDTQIIRYTFTGVTTTALATGVEFCFAATTPATPGNYNIPFSDTNDGDYGPALIYVGDDNDVTLTATIPITLSLRIKEPATTADTNLCALGVLNPGSVNSCSYRIAAGTNISTGLQVFTFADNQLNTAGDSADIDDTAGGATVTAGVEEHGILVTLGTGWAVGGSFSATTDEVMPLAETLILDAAASISDSVEANWSTITHSASVNSGTSGGAYDQLVTYRAWVDT